MERCSLFTRNSAGDMLAHHGTGKAAPAFRDYQDPVGAYRSWKAYNALVELSPVTVHNTGGGILGRDTAGALWYWPTTGDGHVIGSRKATAPVGARVKAGTGWNGFTAVVWSRRPDLRRQVRPARS
ncbi:hypothetical protein NLX86_24390 [Streptomyces sp. A3M-1-3]|uniref:hypothetical protein n=1 Tax=Streptomyces sp. A3M-1-3 TaxID=2962044 RepID=UPI0020B758C0|nr:hypothetical protein [Streptomyces sp. A3M-1-3]MCP3821115.1 hypothetical protein [Streptomyces sp. A3M-1-3]